MGHIQGTNKVLAFESLAHHLLRTSKTVFQAHGPTNPGEKSSVELHNPSKCNVTADQLFQSNDFKIEDKKYYTPTNSSFTVGGGRHIDVVLDVPNDREFAHRRIWASHQVGQQMFFCSSATDTLASTLKLIFVVRKSEEERVRCMQPQALVCTISKKPASSDGPPGEWNVLKQFVVFVSVLIKRQCRRAVAVVP
ncbi:MAG: hypothetical protein SGPRY_002622, partial [Prymnesium sp.]